MPTKVFINNATLIISTYCGNPINYGLPVNYTEIRIPEF